MASMGRPGAPDLLEKIPASYTVAPAPSALIPKALRFVGDSATRSATCKSMVASATTPLLQRWACFEGPLDLRWKDYEMRKGFTRKPKADEPATQGKNYITPSGLQRLHDEHRFLLSRERPAVTEVVAWAASNGDRSENADYQYGKRRLRQIDGRIRFLRKRIEAAEVVDPETPRTGQAAT